MKYTLFYSCVSHIGKVRKINQDNYICDNMTACENDGDIVFPINGAKEVAGPCLFGVFDGMGGEECGEVASYIAAKNAACCTFGRDPARDFMRLCSETNDNICDYIRDNHLIAMGTTAAMLVFSPLEINLCNIGDSKIFRFSDGDFEQISVDHLAAAPFGTKPPLTQNLGIPPTEFVIDPYLAKGKPNNGDIYLICSDGLTDMVSLEDIKIIINSEPLEEACVSLQNKALDNGGKDNITIILCKIKRKPFWHFRRFSR